MSKKQETITPQMLARMKKRKSWVLLVVLLALCYTGFLYVQQEGTMRKQQQDLATMQQQVADQQLINYELQDQIARVGSDSYIEQQAREDVGLVKDGETRYIVVPNEDADTPAQPTETPAESAAPAESQAPASPTPEPPEIPTGSQEPGVWTPPES